MQYCSAVYEVPETLVGAKSVCCCCLRCPEDLADMTTGEPSLFHMMSSCFGYVNVQPSDGVLLMCSECKQCLIQSWEFLLNVRATQRLLRTMSCRVNVGSKMYDKTRNPLFEELKLFPIAEISHSTATEFQPIVGQSEATPCVDLKKEIKTEIEDEYKCVKLESRDGSDEYTTFQTEPTENKSYLTEDDRLKAIQPKTTDFGMKKLLKINVLPKSDTSESVPRKNEDGELSNEQISKRKCLASERRLHKRSEKKRYGRTHQRPSEKHKFEIRSKDNSVVFRKLMTHYDYNSLKKVSPVDGEGTASAANDGIYVVKPEDLTCKICDETFQWPRLLHKHLAEHFPRYVCQVCGKRYAFHTGFLAHLNTHDDTVFACDICGRSFNWKGSLIRHIKDHSVGCFKHRCLRCPEKFTNFYTKMKHLSEVHGDDSKKRTCSLCPQSFLTVGCLKKHVARMHRKEERAECTVCGKKFHTKTDLRSHSVMHSEVKAFVCRVCNKSYKRKKTLTEHMKIHTDDKRFQCTVCERRFTQKCVLVGHMKTHRKDTHEVPTNKHENQTY